MKQDHDRNRANVRELTRPFDPMGQDAEDQYDAVVRRLRRVRARLARNVAERGELERQFVHDDLHVQSGRRAGQRLSATGRRRRLNRLMALAGDAERLRSEELFASRALGRMNQELERWARETYGS